MRQIIHSYSNLLKMSKILKIILYSILGVVIFIGLGACIIHFRGIPSYTPKKINLKVEITPEKVMLGRKIVEMQCTACHKNPKTGKLTGMFRSDLPKEFGTIHSANITQSKKNGIGLWSDGDIAYFLRTGVKPNGKYAPPYMPKNPLMASEDMEAIIAYLRSNDSSVQASEEKTTPCEPSFLTKFLCTFVATPNPYLPNIPKPNLKDKINYGKYLVTAQLDCYACHSADFKTLDLMNPEKSVGFLGGGNKLLDLQGNPIYTPNLTFDKNTGIGKWSEAEFVKALKTGIRPNKDTYRYPMLPFVYLEDEEVKAIYTYLKTVPHISNKVEEK